MTSFQAVAWHGEDSDQEYIVHIFGRTEDGKSVHVETPFEPYFFVKVPPGRTPKAIVQELNPYSTATIRRKDLWGFRNQEESTFVKLGFRTLAELKECRPRGLKVYEKNLDPLLRFMHRTEIKSTGWVQVPANASPGHDSTCDLDFVVSDWRTLKPIDRDDIAPLRIASIDIEACSESGAFPDSFKTNDVCFQVAITTREFGKEGWFDRKCLCVKQTTGFDSFETEREMLEKLGEYLQKLDPDIITGWNIFGFDLEYLYTRTVVTAAGPKAHHWGRLKGRTNELVIKQLSSNALGDNKLKMVPMLGRYVFDMFQDVKREHKLESYSLNNVSKVFLNDSKIDMPVKEMFARFREGDPDKLGEVADYCVKDTELPHSIAAKLCLIQNLIEMAKATWVPLSYLSERGQQIKVFSQVCRKARELGFMVPTMYPKDTQEDKYQGATVLDAQTGAYYSPITALDFASLYPSIMRAHNLCFSTLVMEKRFENIPGVEYEKYGPHKFAQNVPSLLPIILNELAAFRKKAKKLMAAAEGTPMEAVYNGQQLAYKISMNSIYGFTGATKGMLPCVAIASTVTMRGRQMIEETKAHVEANFPGAKVRYGDSVMPETPVLVRTSDGNEFRPEIQSLANSWFSYDHFKSGVAEQCESLDLECMTHLGWKKIKRVVRHKSCKKIYRVYSPYGRVDVTEDHSLLDEDLILIKPYEIKEDDHLLHFGKDIEGSNYVKLLHESWKGYVYDIETEAGTFAAGNGTLIVKNTDSVMVEFDVQWRKGQEAIDYSWAQGELAAEACTKLFKAPNDLELEKVYCPYFLYSKKRYAAKMYEKKGNAVVFKKIDIKGLQVVRRDTSPYVRGILKELLNLVLNSEDPRPAIEYARESARKLLRGKVDSKELTMSKQLSAEYKNRVPHVEVRNKIRERAPGSEPQNGDRVPFLITKGGRLLYEKAEDPAWVAEKNIPIDYTYYFEHQMSKSVCDLLEPLVGNNAFQAIFKSIDFLTTPPITSFFAPKHK